MTVPARCRRSVRRRATSRCSISSTPSRPASACPLPAAIIRSAITSAPSTGRTTCRLKLCCRTRESSWSRNGPSIRSASKPISSSTRLIWRAISRSSAKPNRGGSTRARTLPCHRGEPLLQSGEPDAMARPGNRPEEHTPHEPPEAGTCLVGALCKRDGLFCRDRAAGGVPERDDGRPRQDHPGYRLPGRDRQEQRRKEVRADPHRRQGRRDPAVPLFRRRGLQEQHDRHLFTPVKKDDEAKSLRITNKFMSDRSFVRAYVDKDKDIVVETDIAFSGGITKDHYKVLLDAFEDHVKLMAEALKEK